MCQCQADDGYHYSKSNSPSSSSIISADPVGQKLLGSVIDDDEVIVADDELEEDIVVIEPEEVEEKDVVVIEPEEVEEKEVFVDEPDDEEDGEVFVVETEDEEDEKVFVTEPEDEEDEKVFVIEPVEDANDKDDDFEMDTDLEVLDDEAVTVTTILSCSSGSSTFGRGFFATGTSCCMMTKIGIGIGIMSFPFESLVPFANVQVSGTLQVLQDSEWLIDVTSLSVDQVVE